MTYRVPELMLIGAATHLVLEGSGSEHLKLPGGAAAWCDAATDEISEPDLYSLSGNW